MNLLSKLGSAVTFVKTKVGEAVSTARAEFGDALTQPLKTAAAQVRTSINEGITGARTAAANAIAQAGAGAGVQIASRVAPSDHWTQRAKAFLDLDPKSRNIVIFGLIALAIVLVVVFMRKR